MDSEKKQQLAQQLRVPELFRQSQFIDGIWCNAIDGKSHSVVNPATIETIAEVPFSGSADVAFATLAAARAQVLWQQVVPAERAKILRRWRDLIIEV
jgi:succinate-semialdehyde dehydrogenase / glutarate-semialdehyde dehydrogenase